jgi:hypothetical protein
MQIRWKTVLPLAFLATACLSILSPFGIALAVTLGLPWTFFGSFVTGPAYALLPNLSEFVGLFLILVPPLIINAWLLFLLGKYVDSRKHNPKTAQ